MTAALDIHSRSRLAGYDPDRLFGASALIVGAGALGQNLAVNLALAGIGTIVLIDDDEFLPHNATRSPLYPTPEEAALWGMTKSIVAAHKLLPMMTAPAPHVRYAVARVQAVGDGAITASDIVFAAVDNAAARAYLAERCRLLGKPLVEAGFDGPRVNVALFVPDSGAACYRCLNPATEATAFSCTRYALAAEQAQIIPAIQNAAAVLAGLQAEQGIQWLHGAASLAGRRAYLDMRDLTLSVVTMTPDPACPGIHHAYNTLPEVLSVGADATISDLLAAIAARLGSAEVVLPTPLVVRNFCVDCGALCNALTPVWQWLVTPRCLGCGGPFPHAASGRAPDGIDWVPTDSTGEITAVSCAAVGLPAGASLEAVAADGDRYLFRVRGEAVLSEVLSIE